MLKSVNEYTFKVSNDSNFSQERWRPLAPFSIPQATSILTLNFLYMTAFYGTYSYLGIHLRENYGVNTIEAGYAVLAYGIGFGFASMADSIIDKYGVRRVSVFIFIALCCNYIALSYTFKEIIKIYFMCLIWGFLNHLGLSAIITLLGQIQTQIKGQLMGMNSVFTYLGGSFGTFFFGYLYLNESFSMVALFAAGSIAFMLLLFIIFVRGNDKSC